MIVNIIIAVLLSVLSILLTYAIWYIVRGRAKKDRLSGGKNKGGKAPAPQGPYGPQSYCYPKINEVMGYDFVTVVGIPAELRKPAARKDKSWADTPGIGMKTVRNYNAESPEDEIYPDDNPSPETPQNATAPSKPGPTPEENAREEVEQTEVIPSAYNMSPEEMAAINSMADWTNRDFDAERGDDYWNNILDENEDLVEEGEISPEDLQTAREREALLAIKEMEDIFDDQDSFAAEAGEIMKEIENA